MEIWHFVNIAEAIRLRQNGLHLLSLTAGILNKDYHKLVIAALFCFQVNAFF